MVTLKGQQIELVGTLLQEGSALKDFELVDNALNRVHLNYFEGRALVLHTFPSLDTSVCQKSLLTLEQKLKGYDHIKLVHISKDLPFAQKRYLKENQVESACALSAFDSSFGKDYGLEIGSGPLKGLLARSLFLVDEKDKVVFANLVPEISDEPNYGQLLEQIENHLKG